MSRSLIVAPTGQQPTIAALFVARIDGCPSNTNNPIKQSTRRRASVGLLLPTIQPIQRSNNGRARLARSGIVAGPISVTNPGSGFERRSSLATRSAFGVRDERERETVTDANANLSRMRTRSRDDT